MGRRRHRQRARESRRATESWLRHLHAERRRLDAQRPEGHRQKLPADTPDVVRSCLAKHRFPSWHVAFSVAKRIARQSGTPRMEWYHCLVCDGFHLTRHKWRGG